MSLFGDFGKFAMFNLGDQWDKIKQNPERPFIGAMDEGSTKVWNKAFDLTSPITGINRHYQPMTDYFGGAPQNTYDKAKAQGINTGPFRTGQNIANTITAAYVGGYGAGQLGGGGGAISGGTESINPATGVGWSETGSGLAGNGGAVGGGSSGGFGLNPAMSSGVTSTGYGTTAGGNFGLNPAMGDGVTSTGYGTTAGGDFDLNAASPSGIQGTESAAGLGDLSANGNGANSASSLSKNQLLSQALRGMGGGQKQQQQPLIDIIKEQPAFLQQTQALPIQDSNYTSNNPYIVFQNQNNNSLASALRNG